MRRPNDTHHSFSRPSGKSSHNSFTSRSAAYLCTMITHQEILDHFDYNPVTGNLYRVLKSGSTKLITSKNKDGYLQTGYDYRHYYAHRLAWMYVHGEMPKGQIDHINGRRADNRIFNLRQVSNRENQRNQRLREYSESGCPGVYATRKNLKWSARIRVDGSQINLGTYQLKSEAIKARKEADEKYGFHENHGIRSV